MFSFDLRTETYLGTVTNLIALFLLAMVVMFCLRTVTIKSKKNFNFYILFGVSFVEILTHLVTTIIQKDAFFGSDLFGVIMYSLVFTINFLFLIAWVYYLSTKLIKSHRNKKRFVIRTTIFSTPLIILFFMSIINMITPVFFSYVNDEYTRKWLYNLTLVVPLCYLVVGIILFLRNNNRKRIYLDIPFVELLVPVLLSHIVEKIFIGICVIPLGNVISLMILVFNNMQRNISVDNLTSLYTRKELFDYLDGYELSNNKKTKIFGIMFDLDDFKSINDTYGHIVGDDALREFGYIVRTHLNSKSLGFRYAGDEFVIIVKSDKEEDAINVANSISDALLKANKKNERIYQLNASFGITSLSNEETITKFVERMDSKMYENKSTKKYTRIRQLES